MRNKSTLSLIFLLTSLLSACAVGPDYKRPCVCIPDHYKEYNNWKIAKPADCCDRGQWWKIFNDSELNLLEARLNICNQTIGTAVGQYYQALALIDEARAAYFPTV